MNIEARKCEITLVVDSGIGKTTIMFSLTNNRTDLNIVVPTIGFEYGSTLIHNDGIFSRVSIFDLSGNSIYKSIISTYFIDKDGLILAFNLNSVNSFSNLQEWINLAKCHIDSKKPMYLIGIQIENQDKKINLELIDLFVIETGIEMYKEVNIANHKNLRNAFVEIIRDVMNKFPLEEIDLKYTDKDKLIERVSNNQCCNVQCCNVQ